MLKEVTRGGARPGADDGSRVLIYSHDTFGLGHLRRCLTIANSLVENHKQLSALILSGSPIIGRFDFRARVDFVRVPGVIKLRNGEYTIHFGENKDLPHPYDLRRAAGEERDLLTPEAPKG